MAASISVSLRTSGDDVKVAKIGRPSILLFMISAILTPQSTEMMVDSLNRDKTPLIDPLLSTGRQVADANGSSVSTALNVRKRQKLHKKNLQHSLKT